MLKLATFFLVAFWLAPPAQAFVGFEPKAFQIDAKACSKLLVEQTATDPSLQSMSTVQRQFLDETFLPVVGKRALMKDAKTPRPFKVGEDFLEFGAFEIAVKRGHRVTKVLKIQWIEPSEKDPLPWVESSPTTLTLKIPKNFDWSKERNGGAAYIREFLMGHPWHPYTGWKQARAERVALGEPDILLKQTQIDAITAMLQLLDNLEEKGFQVPPQLRTFLLVAPTAVGKTEIVRRALQFLSVIVRESPRPLHIILADQVPLLHQLKDDFKSITKGCKVHFWGQTAVSKKKKSGKDSQKPPTKGSLETKLKNILEEASTSEKPIYLFTTIQSLKSALGIGKRHPKKKGVELQEALFELLRGVTASLTYDEAHHGGAAQAAEVIKQIAHHTDSQVLLLGATATPVNKTNGILPLFNGRAFWVYRDTPESFHASGGQVVRTLDEMVNQLKTGIEEAELTPINSMTFLSPRDFGGLPIYVKTRVRDGSGFSFKWQINPDIEKRLLEKARPKFLKAHQGFGTFYTIAEVRRWTKLFQEFIPEKKFAYLHSNTPEFPMSTEEQEEVLEKLQSGEIDFVFTVRKVDEGLNIQEFDLWADFNRTIGFRQIMQRQGRPMRLMVGKEGLDILSLFSYSDKSLKEAIRLYEHILAGDFGSRLRRTHVDEHGRLLKEEKPDSENLKKTLDELRDRERNTGPEHFANALIQWATQTQETENLRTRRLPSDAASNRTQAGEIERKLASTLLRSYVETRDEGAYRFFLETLRSKKAHDLADQIEELRKKIDLIINPAVFALSLVNFDEKNRGAGLPMTPEISKPLHQNTLIPGEVELGNIFGTHYFKARYFDRAENLAVKLEKMGRADLARSLRLAFRFRFTPLSPFLAAESIVEWAAEASLFPLKATVDPLVRKPIHLALMGDMLVRFIKKSTDEEIDELPQRLEGKIASEKIAELREFIVFLKMGLRPLSETEFGRELLKWARAIQKRENLSAPRLPSPYRAGRNPLFDQERRLGKLLRSSFVNREEKANYEGLVAQLRKDGGEQGESLARQIDAERRATCIKFDAALFANAMVEFDGTFDGGGLAAISPLRNKWELFLGESVLGHTLFDYYLKAEKKLKLDEFAAELEKLRRLDLARSARLSFKYNTATALSPQEIVEAFANWKTYHQQDVRLLSIVNPKVRTPLHLALLGRLLKKQTKTASAEEKDLWSKELSLAFPAKEFKEITVFLRSLDASVSAADPAAFAKTLVEWAKDTQRRESLTRRRLPTVMKGYSAEELELGRTLRRGFVDNKNDSEFQKLRQALNELGAQDLLEQLEELRKAKEFAPDPAKFAESVIQFDVENAGCGLPHPTDEYVSPRGPASWQLGASFKKYALDPKRAEFNQNLASALEKLGRADLARSTQLCYQFCFGSPTRELVTEGILDWVKTYPKICFRDLIETDVHKPLHIAYFAKLLNKFVKDASPSVMALVVGDLSGKVPNEILEELEEYIAMVSGHQPDPRIFARVMAKELEPPSPLPALEIFLNLETDYHTDRLETSARKVYEKLAQRFLDNSEPSVLERLGAELRKIGHGDWADVLPGLVLETKETQTGNLARMLIQWADAAMGIEQTQKRRLPRRTVELEQEVTKEEEELALELYRGWNSLRSNKRFQNLIRVLGEKHATDLATLLADEWDQKVASTMTAREPSVENFARDMIASAPKALAAKLPIFSRSHGATRGLRTRFEARFDTPENIQAIRNVLLAGGAAQCLLDFDSFLETREAWELSRSQTADLLKVPRNAIPGVVEGMRINKWVQHFHGGTPKFTEQWVSLRTKLRFEHALKEAPPFFAEVLFWIEKGESKFGFMSALAPEIADNLGLPDRILRHFDRAAAFVGSYQALQGPVRDSLKAQPGFAKATKLVLDCLRFYTTAVAETDKQRFLGQVTKYVLETKEDYRGALKRIQLRPEE